MRPSHPCPTCGHASSEECSRAAEAVRAERGVACTSCQDLCLHRAMQNPSPPGAMVQPGISSDSAPTPPTPPDPLPNVGPPAIPPNPAEP
jgi:hypothetical protein